MIIVISGTPGTGKHLIGKKLSERLGYKLLDLNKILKSGKKGEVEVSITEINRIVAGSISGNTVVVSHLGHFIRSKKVSLWVVLRCRPLVLYKRLLKRGYSKQKIYDNAMFEAIDGCYVESKSLHKNTIQIDNTHNPDKTVDEIINAMKGKKHPNNKVDYSSEIPSIEKIISSAA